MNLTPPQFGNMYKINNDTSPALKYFLGINQNESIPVTPGVYTFDDNSDAICFIPADDSGYLKANDAFDKLYEETIKEQSKLEDALSIENNRAKYKISALSKQETTNLQQLFKFLKEKLNLQLPDTFPVNGNTIYRANFNNREKTNMFLTQGGHWISSEEISGLIEECFLNPMLNKRRF